MKNMGYCRFENTVRDMRYCIDVLEENGFDIDSITESLSSDDEVSAMKWFIKLCKYVAEEFDGDL